MKIFFTASLLIVFFLSFSAGKAETYKQIRLAYSDTSRIIELLHHGIEPIQVKTGEYIDYAVTPPEQAVFDRLGIIYTTIHKDMTAFYQSRNPTEALMGGFYTFPEMEAMMDSFHTNYPAICSQKTSIATTEGGRHLWVFKISDNVDQNEAEPEVFINSLIHAREPLGGQVTMEFARWLLTGYGTDTLATRIVNNYQIYFLPCVNPDGYEYNRQTNPGGGGMWRKNRRNNGDGTYGVDDNRNWRYAWGYDDNGSSPNTNDDTYRGVGPNSEPETAGIQNFLNAHDFTLVINYHTYGNHFQYPWGYYENGFCPEPDHSYFEDTLATYSRNQGFAVGPCWEILYIVNGESVDEDYGDDRLRRSDLALVFEIGTDNDGFWPDISRIPTLVTQNKNILKDLIPRAYDILKRRNPPQPTITGPASAPAGAPFYLHWHPDAADTFNAAVSYRVVEGAGLARLTQGFENSSGFTLDGFTLNSTNHHGGNYSAYSGHGPAQRKYVTLDDRLKVQIGDNITFWTRYDMTTDYDYAYVQISTNGGVSWINLDGTLSTTNNPHNHNFGHGITGTTSGSFVQGTYWLYNYVGHEVKIRVAYYGATGGGEGIYIDDVFPDPTYASTNVLGETVYGDSLLVGPYPLGTQWFQVYSRDDRGQISPSSDRFQIDILGSVYNLSGHIALSDSPGDLSGSIVGIASLSMADTTDSAGNFAMAAVPQGIYNVVVSHPGYYPDTIYSFNVSHDTTLNATLNPSPPAQPVLSLPANNATLDTEYVAFDWNDVVRADNYIIEIAADSNFANILMFDSTLAASAYHNALPFANSSYYWRVTAHNSIGFSPRSAKWKFTINVTLSAPNLVAPANGFVTDSSYVNFDWSDVNRATRYIIEISRNSNFSDIAVYDSSLTVSSYRNPAPLPNLTYYWRVTAANPTLISPRSSSRSFTINVLVQAPTLLAPPNNALLGVSNVNFDWDDIPGAVSYVIEVAHDSIFADIVATDSTLTLSSYSHSFGDARYFWRVTAFNGFIYSSRSAIRSFTVTTFLSAPILGAPADGFVSNVNRVDFDWSDVPNAVSYVFEVAADSNFVNHVFNDSTVSNPPHPQVGPFADGLYYWRVTAAAGQVYSQRSPIRTFIVSTFIPGDANNNGIVNGLDVIYLVNYLRGFGPTPNPLLAADANGNCAVNGIDVIYLVNYFKGFGPAPIRGDCLAEAKGRQNPVEH
jgi:hypothetical protein